MQSKVVRGSRTTFRYFFQKVALYSTRIPGFPVGEAVGFCRLKRSLHAFPLPKKNSVPSFLRQKLSASSRIPLVSSCLRTIRQKCSATSWLPLGGKLSLKATDEGRSQFLIEFFHQKFSIKGQLHFRKSHSVHLLPCFAASPCLIVLAHNKAKIVSRFAASPRGEAPCKARW